MSGSRRKAGTTDFYYSCLVEKSSRFHHRGTQGAHYSHEFSLVNPRVGAMYVLANMSMEATKMIQDEPSSRSARPQKLERTRQYVSFKDAHDAEMGHHEASARSSKIVAMASILILGGVIPLAGALLAQVGLGLHPCHFCLLQRYPYGLVIAAGVLSLLVTRGGLKWRFLVALGILGLLATATLGLIHTGIEMKWIVYTGGCVAQSPVDGSLEALRAAISAAPQVACDEASAVFFGLSMATWNVIWASFVLVLVALQYRCDRRRYDTHNHR